MSNFLGGKSFRNPHAIINDQNTIITKSTAVKYMNGNIASNYAESNDISKYINTFAHTTEMSWDKITLVGFK